MTFAPADHRATPGRPPQPAARRPRTRFKTPRIVAALMLREIASSYGRSAGGYLWTVAEPVAGIALLSFIFSMTFARPALGDNFAMFYATGYLPFSLYNDLSSRMARAVPYSRALLAYPAVTYSEALIARLVLNFLTQSTVVALILGGTALIYGLEPHWNLSLLTQSVLLTTLLAAGVGTLNAYLFLEFPVWERAWGIAMRPLFLISGAIFTYDMMPPAARAALYWNPLIHTTGLMRAGVYGTYDADYVSRLFVAAVGLVTLFFGLLLLSRHYRRLIES